MNSISDDRADTGCRESCDVEQGIDTLTAEGSMFGMLSVLAEFQRELVVVIIYTRRFPVRDMGLRHAC